MQEQDILEMLLLRLDSAKEDWQVLRAHETETWPRGMLTTLCETGLIAETTPSNVYTCTSCDDEHDEDVFAIESPEESEVRLYIQCPSVGRVRVDPEKLKQWCIIPQELVEIIRSFLNITSPVQEIINDRVWQIGITKINDTTREIMMIRGLNWKDGQSIRERALKGTNRDTVVILSPYYLPDDSSNVISLARILRFTKDGFTIDRPLFDLTIANWGHPLENSSTTIKVKYKRWVTTNTKISIKKIIWQRYAQGENAAQIQRFFQLHAGERKYKDSPESVKTINKDIQDFFRMPDYIKSTVLEKLPELHALTDKK